MIKLITKEPFRAGINVIYPVVMIKDNKEIHIINKIARNDKKYERIINILKISDGKYTVFYGAYDNPFDMLQNIVEGKQVIKNDLKEDIFDVSESDGNFTDFIGFTSPNYSIFNYRIYDVNLLQDIKKIVELINRKEWDMAKVEIEKKRNNYKEITKNTKDKVLGLGFDKFYQLIDKQVESVKQSPNYKIFKNDVEVLKNVNTGVGLASITANNWLKQICNLSEVELKEYVDIYNKGTLDPYFYEKEDKRETEREEIEQ